MAKERRSGLLLHVTSLPSPFGVGDLGAGAYRFADFLSAAGQRLWQILPLSPVTASTGWSPYQSYSGFAGNPLLVSPELLVGDGFLPASRLDGLAALPEGRADYDGAAALKGPLLDEAWERCRGGRHRDEFDEFCARESEWLDDFSLFAVLREVHGGRPWTAWPRELRDREPEAMATARGNHAAAVERTAFFQFLFSRQWEALRGYCRDRGIEIFGDMPIYLEHHSADVWAEAGLFDLDAGRRPRFVSGVPPDYFSETGQLWGNPLYRWDVLRERGFDWWLRRIGRNLELYDLLRIDHFRGLVAFWEVPAKEETAVVGRWVPVPADEFFTTLLERHPASRFVAEDLGIITPDVEEIRRRFGLPGMRVLIFAFGDEGGGNPYLPHNHDVGSFVYTGTHDNNTARGWFETDATPGERAALARYLGRDVTAGSVGPELARLAMMSVARTAVIPVQDLLGLGGECRMNNPAVAAGNWRWRLEPGALTPTVEARLREMTETYGRR